MNKTPISEVFNCDCMEYMKGLPDGFADLAICDPPYGIGDRLSNGGGKLKNTPMATLYRKSRKWDDVKPGDWFFQEVFRVSKNSIIWGGNYFVLPPSRGIIFWDKEQYLNTLSQFELGWTSFDCPAKVFRLVSTDLLRFHPTQKPIALYKWLLTNYAKPGQTIFDPIMGSQSSRIAAWDMGFDYYGCELDEDYFRDGCKRFEQHRANKTSLFEPGQMYQFEQQKLFE